MCENNIEEKEEFLPKSIQIRKTVLSSMREWLAVRGYYRKDSVETLIKGVFALEAEASVYSYHFTMHNYSQVMSPISLVQLMQDTSTADTTTLQISDKNVYEWAKKAQEHCQTMLQYDVSLGQIVEGQWIQFLISEEDPDAKRLLQSMALISVSDNLEDEVCIDYIFYRYCTSYASDHYWHVSTNLDQTRNWLAILLIEREKTQSLTCVAEVPFDIVMDKHVRWGESVAKQVN